MLPVAALSGMGNIASAMGGGQIAGAIGKVTAASNALEGQFNKLTFGLNAFTEALNPSLVANLGRTMRDLNAVVGIAAQNMTAMLTPIIRGLADSLMPVMTRLAPVVAQIASALNDRLQKGFDVLILLFDALSPLLMNLVDTFSDLTPIAIALGNLLMGLINAAKPLMDAFSILQNLVLDIITTILMQIVGIIQMLLRPLMVFQVIIGSLLKIFMTIVDSVLRPFMEITKGLTLIFLDLQRVLDVVMAVFMAVVNAIVQAVSALFGDRGKGVQEAMKNLQNVFRELAKASVLLLAAFMKIIGFKDGLDAIIQAVGGNRKDSTGLAVAQNPAFKAIGDLNKDVILSAFTASAGRYDNRKSDDFLRDIEGQLRQMRDSDAMPNIIAMIRDLPQNIAVALRNNTGEAVKAGATEVLTTTSSINSAGLTGVAPGLEGIISAAERMWGKKKR